MENIKANLFKKLLAVQKVLEPLEKTGRNDFHRYNFTTAGDVLLPVQRACNEQGLFISADCIDSKIEPARAEVRKAESKRMAELATTDDNRARLLRDRLKWFFDAHSLKTVGTARYKLSLAKNGGKAPLILKEGLSPTELPEQFQRVSIDPNTTAIREALERGERLNFAQLGERGTSIRIK